MRANRVGCRRTVGEGGRNNFMDSEITTPRGSFGRIQVTLPMDIKTKMMQWYQKSGLRKSEFFRVALMIGVCILADSVNAKSNFESYQSDEDNQTDAIART